MLQPEEEILEIRVEKRKNPIFGLWKICYLLTLKGEGGSLMRFFTSVFFIKHPPWA
jgi:hypothetical protein